MSESPTIGFLGGGNMAEAIIGGLRNRGHASSSIRVGEPREERCAELRAKFGISASTDNLDVIENSDVLILAVKPQVMEQVLTPLREKLRTRKPLLISIAAGITLRNLESWIDPDMSLVRCMPNTPALVGAGVSGLCPASRVSERDRQLTEDIIGSVGPVHWVADEAQLDALMAISGCGPAYFFAFVEHLEAAGKQLGLPEEMAEELAAQTAWGSIKLLHETQTPPAELRRRVTSPGGTTQAALEQFAADDLAGIVQRATKAAVQRATELAGDD